MLAAASSAVGALFALAPFYYVPSIVAAVRKMPNVGSIFLVNLLLGWTLVGWMVALAMAIRSVPSRA